MQIDGLSSSTLPPPPTGDKTEKSSTDEFLRLLVAQLEQQNPLDPQSGAEFVAQLAQFSAVEQSVQTNSLLEEIRADQVSSASLAMSGLVGRTATVDADNVELEGSGGIPSLGVELDDPADSVTVEITDSGGNIVKTMDLGPQGAGKIEAPWDGTDQNGAPLPPGEYNITVRATDKEGTELPGSAFVRGLIDAVSMDGGYPKMRIGGARFAPADLRDIE